MFKKLLAWLRAKPKKPTDVINLRDFLSVCFSVLMMTLAALGVAELAHRLIGPLSEESYFQTSLGVWFASMLVFIAVAWVINSKEKEIPPAREPETFQLGFFVLQEHPVIFCLGLMFVVLAIPIGGTKLIPGSQETLESLDYYQQILSLIGLAFLAPLIFLTTITLAVGLFAKRKRAAR